MTDGIPRNARAFVGASRDSIRCHPDDAFPSSRSGARLGAGDRGRDRRASIAELATNGIVRPGEGEGPGRRTP